MFTLGRSALGVVCPPAEQLDGVGHDFKCSGFRSVLPGIFPGADTSFHINLGSLVYMVSGQFRQLAPRNDAVPFGHFFRFAGIPVAVALRGGQ